MFWLLGLIVAVGCSTSGTDESSSQVAGDATPERETDKATIEASLFCCTLREYCLACGCNAAESQIVESKVEAACKQLLDSNEYACAAGDEMTALAQCASGAASPASDDDLTRCVKWHDDGCICREDRYESDVPFEGTCEASSVGEPSLCCSGDGYCHCEPVLCGFSVGSGTCICGVGVAFDFLVESCDDIAQTCCTQNTGYCYCEDGCEQNFGSYLVSSCNQNTPTASCYDDEVRMAGCEGTAAETELPASQPDIIFAPVTVPVPDEPVVVPVPDEPAPQPTSTEPSSTPVTTDPVSGSTTDAPDTDSSETPTISPYEVERRFQAATCKFEQRCTPGLVETELQDCIDRGMTLFDNGFYLIREANADAAACYDALADLPCGEFDSRDTDAHDQHQWFHLNAAPCLELTHYACMSDSECPADWLCSGEGGQCGECIWNGTCSVDSDCQLGDDCIEGACIARVGVGQPCIASSQCIGGRCDDGICVEALPLGADCTEFEACGYDAWCSDGACAPPGQVGDACEEGQWVLACLWGLDCIDGRCQPWGPQQTALAGEHCLFNEQCVRGLSCYGLVCGPSPDAYCHSDNECLEDEYCAPFCEDSNGADCTFRVCRPKLLLGDPCAMRSDCQSDACSDDGQCIERASCE